MGLPERIKRARRINLWSTGRNRQIYDEWLSGIAVKELQRTYCLSESGVRYVINKVQGTLDEMAKIRHTEKGKQQ